MPQKILFSSVPSNFFVAFRKGKMYADKRKVDPSIQSTLQTDMNTDDKNAFII